MELIAKSLHVGFHNYIIISRIIAIMGSEGLPMKRLRNEIYQQGKLIDFTRGRKSRAMILMDNGYLILSAIHPDTLFKRFQEQEEIMPVKRCQRNDEQGWKWGDEGFCYVGSEEGSDNAARQKALAQGRAIQANQQQEEAYTKSQSRKE